MCTGFCLCPYLRTNPPVLHQKKATQFDNKTCHLHKFIYRTEHSSDELDVNSKTKPKWQKKARWHYISFLVPFWQRQRCTTRTLKHKPEELTFPSTNHSHSEINLECSKKAHQLTSSLHPRNPNWAPQESLSHFNGTRQETSPCSADAWRDGGSHLRNFFMPYGDKFKIFEGFIRGKEK